MLGNKYDAIIIGAGLGGLTAGATLARDGKKILLVEMHDKVGGFATKFKRKNFVFDVSLHNFGPLYKNEILNSIFTELGILNKIEYIPFESFQRLVFPEHDFIIPKGIDNYTSLLIKEFPKEEEGIKKIFSMMSDIRGEFEEIEKLNVTIDKLEEVYPMLPVKFPMLVKLVYNNFSEILDENINDEKLKGIIGSLWWIYGIPPEKVAAILYSVPTVNYYRHAGGFIKGTSQKLSNALADMIKENGGTIILNTKVNQIIIEGERVVGIITSDNKQYFSNLIISNTSAGETFLHLIDKEKIKKRVWRKIEKLQLSLSGLQLYIGLNCNPTELGIKDHNVTVYQSYDQMQNYNWIIDGEYEKTLYSLTNYSLFDESLCPKGKGIIHILSLDHIKNWEKLSDEEYKKKKENVINIFLNKAEKLFHNIREHIEVIELGTPLTMKRYTGVREGAIYGASQIVEQSGINRLNSKTPVNGLYIVGAYIYPGAGYPSVISSGYKTAKIILENKLENKNE